MPAKKKTGSQDKKTNPDSRQRLPTIRENFQGELLGGGGGLSKPKKRGRDQTNEEKGLISQADVKELKRLRGLMIEEIIKEERGQHILNNKRFEYEQKIKRLIRKRTIEKKLKQTEMNRLSDIYLGSPTRQEKSRRKLDKSKKMVSSSASLKAKNVPKVIRKKINEFAFTEEQFNEKESSEDGSFFGVGKPGELEDVFGDGGGFEDPPAPPPPPPSNTPRFKEERKKAKFRGAIRTGGDVPNVARSVRQPRGPAPFNPPRDPHDVFATAVTETALPIIDEDGGGLKAGMPPKRRGPRKRSKKPKKSGTPGPHLNDDRKEGKEGIQNTDAAPPDQPLQSQPSGASSSNRLPQGSPQAQTVVAPVNPIVVPSTDKKTSAVPDGKDNGEPTAPVSALLSPIPSPSVSPPSVSPPPVPPPPVPPPPLTFDVSSSDFLDGDLKNEEKGRPDPVTAPVPGKLTKEQKKIIKKEAEEIRKSTLKGNFRRLAEEQKRKIDIIQELTEGRMTQEEATEAIGSSTLIQELSLFDPNTVEGRLERIALTLPSALFPNNLAEISEIHRQEAEKILEFKIQPNSGFRLGRTVTQKQAQAPKISSVLKVMMKDLFSKNNQNKLDPNSYTDSLLFTRRPNGESIEKSFIKMILKSRYKKLYDGKVRFYITGADKFLASKLLDDLENSSDPYIVSLRNDINKRLRSIRIDKSVKRKNLFDMLHDKPQNDITNREEQAALLQPDGTMFDRTETPFLTDEEKAILIPKAQTKAQQLKTLIASEVKRMEGKEGRRLKRGEKADIKKKITDKFKQDGTKSKQESQLASEERTRLEQILIEDLIAVNVRADPRDVATSDLFTDEVVSSDNADIPSDFFISEHEFDSSLSDEKQDDTLQELDDTGAVINAGDPLDANITDQKVLERQLLEDLDVTGDEKNTIPLSDMDAEFDRLMALPERKRSTFPNHPGRMDGDGDSDFEGDEKDSFIIDNNESDVKEFADQSGNIAIITDSIRDAIVNSGYQLIAEGTGVSPETLSDLIGTGRSMREMMNFFTRRSIPSEQKSLIRTIRDYIGTIINEGTNEIIDELSTELKNTASNLGFNPAVVDPLINIVKALVPDFVISPTPPVPPVPGGVITESGLPGAGGTEDKPGFRPEVKVAGWMSVRETRAHTLQDKTNWENFDVALRTNPNWNSPIYAGVIRQETRRFPTQERKFKIRNVLPFGIPFS